MAIKLYGSNTCPRTLWVLNRMQNAGYMPDFMNVTGSITLLKEFVRIRDTEEIYKGIGAGMLGFPCIQLEDGTYTRDVEAVMAKIESGEIHN